MNLLKIILGSALFLCDRLTKVYALNNLQELFRCGPYLDFQLTYNYGVSFGLFAARAVYLSIFITGLLLVHMIRDYKNNKMSGLGEWLVLSGACSNLLDRYLYGAVIDFIAPHYDSYYWTVFNLADMVIIAGVMLMLSAEYMSTKECKNRSA